VNHVRTAIIGLGYWGPNLLRNFAAQSECEMIYGCDLEESNIEKARSHYPALTYTKDAEDIFSDSSINLVLIAVPTNVHFPLAKQALENGKHVFIEKPMTSKLEEAEELVTLSHNNQKHIFVDHTFVFAPSVQKMKEAAISGELGDLLYFDSVRINLGFIQKDINVIEDLAIHDLSILNTFMDLAAVETIAAHGSTHYGTQTENAHLFLTWKNGFQAHIHVGWLSPVKMRKTILAGSKAMMTYDDIEPSEKIRLYDKGVVHDASHPDPMLPSYRSGDIVIPAIPPKETLAIEAQHVLKCVNGNEKPYVSGGEGVKVLRILERARYSLESNGAPVSYK
jgi:predicted dehydrogenase